MTADTREDRRRKIADAARRIFVQKGFEATSMADIIAESGVSAGALYVHYENKSDLVQKVVNDILDDSLAELRKLRDRVPLPNPAEVVTEIVRDSDDPKAPHLRMHSWSACVREPLLTAQFARFALERHAVIAEYMQAWLRQSGLDEATATARSGPLAQLLIGLCRGYYVQVALVPELRPEDYLAALGWLDFAAPNRKE